MNKVLVVEPHQGIAILLEMMLLELDFEVLVAATLSDALAHASGADICGALLEADIGHSKIYAVADALAQRGIPFAFVISVGRGGLDVAYAQRPVLVKPFRRRELADVIESLQLRPPRCTSTTS